MKTIRHLLLAAVALVAIAFAVPAPIVSAASADSSQHAALGAATAPTPLLLAQVTPPAPDAKPPVVASTPWYADGTVIAGFIAFITSITAIWSHTEKRTAQKISESLVAGIEAATKIPAVAAQEKIIKARIQAVATDYGVQPLLDKIVQEVTA